MELKRVNRYAGARYPNRPAVDGDPKILGAIPRRWRDKPVVLGALSSLLGLAAGCQVATGAQKIQAKHGPLVAPLFIHGEGRGAFGCEAVNPPVFLSEAEAREVVIEEAKRAGIHIAAGGPAISGVEMTVYPRGKPATTAPLQPAGTDAAHKISFVVVTEAAAEKWTEPSGSSVELFDAKALAMKITEKVKKAEPKTVVATFYEPFATPTSRAHGWKAAEAETLVRDREELRKQVRDFVQWLKAQGVI